MSSITVDHLAAVMTNPSAGDALPALVTLMRERRNYLRNIKTLHSTALIRERKRFDVANHPESVFSMTRPKSLALIQSYETNIALHEGMLACLHQQWSTFHALMQRGTALLFSASSNNATEVLGGAVQGVEEGFQCAVEAKACLDRIEHEIYEWRSGVASAMGEVEQQQAKDWIAAVTLKEPGMLGVARVAEGGGGGGNSGGGGEDGDEGKKERKDKRGKSGRGGRGGKRKSMAMGDRAYED